MLAELSREDVARGLEALHVALGPQKGRVFLDMIARGALDPNLLTKAQAWARRNPELVTAAGSLVGGFFAALLATSQTQRRQGGSKQALKLLQAVLAQAPQPPQPPASSSEESPPEETVIDTEGETVR